MKPQDRYLMFVRWSEEDRLYVGYCPDASHCASLANRSGLSVSHSHTTVVRHPSFRRVA